MNKEIELASMQQHRLHQLTLGGKILHICFERSLSLLLCHSPFLVVNASRMLIICISKEIESTDTNYFSGRSNYSVTICRAGFTLVKNLKCPNLNITLRTSVKKIFDLHKTRIFYEFYKTFKFAAILAHHSH